MVLSRVRPESVLGHLNHAFRFNPQMFPEPLWGSRIPTLAEGISAGAVGTGSQRNSKLWVLMRVRSSCQEQTPQAHEHSTGN